ncbi:kinase-like domain-containing protein [Apiospora arundinis]|uniref:Rhodopsin domain-containing protein n=1 Tax=Apiospora arundinis TaxID=335852 RepID=A0ABR2I394_9PEZI
MSSSSHAADPPPPPPGYDADWLDPVIITWAVVPTAIAIVVVALRFYTRHYLIKKIEIEDWFALAALLMSIGAAIGTGRQAYFALGKHLSLVDSERLSNYFRAVWYTALFYHLSLGLIKASILFLYIRMFKSYDSLRRASWIVLALVAVGICGILAVMMTACIPLRKKWDHTLEDVDGYCHPVAVWWAITGFQAGSDVIIFLMPLPTICKLRLPRRQKWGLVAVFAVGLFVCLISVMRIVWIYRASDPDFTYTGKSIAEWSCVELNTAVICASLMVLKPLYHKLHPHKTRLILEDDGPGSYEAPPTIGAARARPMLQRYDSGLFNSVDTASRSEDTQNNSDVHRHQSASLRTHGLQHETLGSPTARIMSPTLPVKPFFSETVREKADRGLPIAQLGSPWSVRVW